MVVIFQNMKDLFVYVVTDYILVAEYESCDSNNNCRSFYSWVSVNI